jgi:cytochrome c oxidase cbb3-type subunit 1
MTSDREQGTRRAVELATVHALSFLALGCAVGLLLATLLVAPALGDALAPLSYGRWMPLHLDVLLYGWCALPMVALLLAAYTRGSRAAAVASWPVHAWTAMVRVGCASWLMGGSSGKLFVEWSGVARLAMAAGMAVLALVLVAGFLGRGPRRWSLREAGRGLLLLLLVPVPALLAWAARPDVRPPVNPDSGGPTGGSLLGSTLGIVAVILLTPPLLGLVPRRAFLAWGAAGLLLLHGVAFALLDLVLVLRDLPWPESSRTWLRSSLAWGCLLVGTGLLQFLPGMLERFKFGHGLVLHAHVALAGFLTSWSFVVLTALSANRPLATALGDRGPALVWNVGLAAHLASLLGLAAVEQAAPSGLLAPGAWTTALLWARWLAGAVQLGVAMAWLGRAWTAMTGSSGCAADGTAQPAGRAA